MTGHHTLITYTDKIFGQKATYNGEGGLLVDEAWPPVFEESFVGGGDSFGLEAALVDAVVGLFL